LALPSTSQIVESMFDHQRLSAGAGTARPCPFEGVADDRFHLTAVPERERPQERADRGGSHHPMAEHSRGCSGAKHVGVIDVRPARAQRMGQRQHLPAWAGTANTALKTHRRIDQRFQTEPFRQHRDE
jgi:hypothetical protein